MYPRPESLQSLVPRLDDDGVDLLTNMLHFDPSRRITADDAMLHPFFADLSPAIKGDVRPSAGGGVGASVDRDVV